MSDINEFYKKHFGEAADFSKLSEESKKRADALLASMHSPEIVYVNGKPAYNPARQAFDQLVQSGKFTRQLAQQLGVYSSWKAGITPDEIEFSDAAKRKAAQAGIPQEVLTKLAGDEKSRISKWVDDTVEKFTKFLPPGEKSMPLEEFDVPVKALTVEEQAAAAQKKEQKRKADPPGIPNRSATAPPSGNGTSGQLGPNVWTKQKLVNGSYVPME